jgi:hypothetical protein
VTKLSIDQERMDSAIRREIGHVEVVGYVNRHTGDIALIAKRAEDFEAWGKGLGLEMAAERAAVENRPSDLLEIPKFFWSRPWHEDWCNWRRGGCTCGAYKDWVDDEEEQREEYIAEFVREHGIEAE